MKQLSKGFQKGKERMAMGKEKNISEKFIKGLYANNI